MSVLDQNPLEMLRRVQVLERQLRAVNTTVNGQQTAITTLEEDNAAPAVFASQNYVRNGNFDLDRNRYLYDTDWVGTNAANVSQECAFFYTHDTDTAVESTGTILLASPNQLIIDDPLFVVGDVGLVIAISDGVNPDITTTISAYTNTTTVNITAAVTADYTNARIRWRLLTRTEYATDTTPSTPNTTLKTPAHTLYASTINDPDYDRTNGWVRYGVDTATIDAPMQFNYFTPSKQYIVSFIYRYADSAGITDDISLYVGFWDNTPGQQKFIEGTPLSLTGTIVGTAGVTSRDYMVFMYLGSGETMSSEVETVATTNALLDTTNYVDLSWEQPAGVVRTEIYRKTGAVYELLPFPYPQNTFKDFGQVLRTETGFPTATYVRPISFIRTNDLNFAQPIEGTWQAAQFNVPVASSYDLSKTTDKQWLVIGLEQSLVGASPAHALEIDLISIDDKFGSFTRCPTDFTAKRPLSTAPTSGNQGNTGTGGTPTIPPYCPVFDAMILTDQGEVRAIELVDNNHKYKIINRLGEAVEYDASVMRPQPCMTISADGFDTSAAETHPFFESDGDPSGKRLKEYKQGDTILRRTGVTVVDYVVALPQKKHVVRITLKGNDKGFWQDGFGVHNSKPPPD